MQIPKKLEAAVIGERGAAGRQWLDTVSSKIETYSHKWQLTIDTDGVIRHGHLGHVVPVHLGDEPRVLKLTWIDEETKDEALALRTWNGNGAVKLIENDENEGYSSSCIPVS